MSMCISTDRILPFILQTGLEFIQRTKGAFCCCSGHSHNDQHFQGTVDVWKNVYRHRSENVNDSFSWSVHYMHDFTAPDPTAGSVI